MPQQNIVWPGHRPNQSSAAERKIEPAIILPEDLEPVRAFGDEIHFHAGGAETGGLYTIFTSVTPPGGGPPPHYHKNEDEWFFPLEGRVEFFLNGEWQEVPLRTLVFVPLGTVHTYRNVGDRPLVMLIHTSPSGFEVFFSRCAAEFSSPGTPDMERVVAISAEHGIIFVDE